MSNRDRRHVQPTPTSPYPFLTLIAIAVGGLIAWGSLTPSGSSDPSSQGLLPPVLQTVIVTTTNTPTPVYSQTARVVVLTPTGTSTPLVPFCDQVMSAGTICMALPLPSTATVLPECVEHPRFQYICRKPDAGSGGRGETK